PSPKSDATQKAATEAATPEADPAEAPRPPVRSAAEVVDISAGRGGQPSRTEAPAAPHAAPAAAQAAPRESSGLELAAPVPAAPSVRRFARELGVDIGRVSGT